jgi:outer membrane protein assembly factor BamD
VTKENVAMFNDAVNAGRPAAPAAAVTPTGPNEPPRTDQPSAAPIQMEAPAGGTGVGVTGVGAEIVSAPSGTPAGDPNAVVKAVGPTNSALPAAEKPAEAPLQVNEIKAGTTPTQPAATSGKHKKPKTDLSEDSSSKKKKKKGLDKLNPF